MRASRKGPFRRAIESIQRAAGSGERVLLKNEGASGCAVGKIVYKEGRGDNGYYFSSVKGGDSIQIPLRSLVRVRKTEEGMIEIVRNQTYLRRQE